MATSAKTYGDAIKELSKKYDFDLDDAIEHLASLELLPKKLMPKETSHEIRWASKQAEELSSRFNISMQLGTGTGTDGKFTLTDVKNAISLTDNFTKTISITANATLLAQEHDVDLSKIKGSGNTGRIVLKDIKEFLAEKKRSM